MEKKEYSSPECEEHVVHYVGFLCLSDGGTEGGGGNENYGQ